MVDMQRATRKVHMVCHINFAMTLKAQLIYVNHHSIVLMARQLSSCLPMARYTTEQVFIVGHFIRQMIPYDRCIHKFEN
jgi:hypothetical protein